MIKNSSISKECIFMIGLSLLMITVLEITCMVTWWISAIFVLFYPIFIYYSIRNGTFSAPKEGAGPRPSKRSRGADIL